MKAAEDSGTDLVLHVSTYEIYGPCLRLELLIERGTPGMVYNIAPQRRERTNLKIARSLASAAGHDARVFDIISGLKLFDRGEYEITDVNNDYTRASEMTFDILPGWWADAGTHASKLKALILIALAKGVTFQP